MECRGGGRGGRGDDHDNGSNTSSRNYDKDGAEEEEATFTIVEDNKPIEAAPWRQ
jgi:hypothetical protein